MTKNVFTNDVIAPNITELTNKLNNIQTDFLKLVYPVGSIYIQANVHTNPGTLLGFGTWEEIPDNHYLLSSSSSRTLKEKSDSDFNHSHATGDFTLQTKHLPKTIIKLNSLFISYYTWNEDPWSITNGTISHSESGTFQYNSGGHIGKWTSASLNFGDNTAHNHGNTGSNGSWGPYYRVHIWYRTA